VPARRDASPPPRLPRRGLLAAAASLVAWARSSSADVDPDWRPRELDMREVRVEGSLSRRFVLGVPRTTAPGARLPLLVLLHGLGETGDERMGAWAWFERYGLGSSYDRVIRPGRGLVLACPYMPLLRDSAAAEEYARWLVATLVPRARSEAPVDESRATALAGCSLGGRTSLDVLLRRPEAFGAWGGVQSAIDEGAAERYAERLAAACERAGPRAFFVETSSGDPFRRGNEALARALGRRGIANTYAEPQGPHDQAWLRRIGTANLLEWFAALPSNGGG
jgi:enterochelin esterase-like enzyme